MRVISFTQSKKNLEGGRCSNRKIKDTAPSGKLQPKPDSSKQGFPREPNLATKLGVWEIRVEKKDCNLYLFQTQEKEGSKTFSANLISGAIPCDKQTHLSVTQSFFHLLSRLHKIQEKRISQQRPVSKLKESSAKQGAHVSTRQLSDWPSDGQGARWEGYQSATWRQNSGRREVAADAVASRNSSLVTCV